MFCVEAANLFKFPKFVQRALEIQINIAAEAERHGISSLGFLNFFSIAYIYFKISTFDYVCEFPFGKLGFTIFVLSIFFGYIESLIFEWSNFNCHWSVAVHPLYKRRRILLFDLVGSYRKHLQLLGIETLLFDFQKSFPV